MNTTTRGLIIFGVLIAVVAVLCYWIPFVLFAQWGNVVALPVIEVPGEVLIPGGFFGMDLTNTLVATFIADALVIAFIAMAWRATNGWTNEVPTSRFQAWCETIVEALYDFTKQMAGESPRVRNVLFPLVASIFLFLLAANWIALLPGVDSIGIKHCAHEKQSGYMLNGDSLYNTRPLFPGYTATEKQYKACKEVLEGHEYTGDGELIQLTTEFDDTDRIDEISELLGAYNTSNLDAFADEERDELIEEYGELTGYYYPVYFPDSDDLEKGVVPYSVVITPFVRVAATDLNLTVGLAIVSFFAIQYFGVSALGLDYFQKFVNLRALGNLSKNPMGVIDFGVGLFEIISEFAKVISLAFRLFGNVFAGQLLLFIMPFLIAMILPVVFFGLETIVGFIQALVFSVLTLVFSAQAMVSHHHEDHDEEHH